MALQVTGRARLRVLLIVVVVFGGLAVLVWSRARRGLGPTANPDQQPVVTQTPKDFSTTSPAPATPTVVQSPVAQSPEETPPPQVEQTSPPPELPDSFDNYLGKLNLIIPVTGVKRNQLLDTFADARSEGRVHDAIDIPAPAGTPVIAAIDGEIIKLLQSERGGITIYQLSVDRKIVFYYAHLQRYADGLVAGKFVKQGEIIAYVGDTGNAGAGNFHLHFSILIVSDPKRYWEGTNINPYPLLHK